MGLVAITFCLRKSDQSSQLLLCSLELSRQSYRAHGKNCQYGGGGSDTNLAELGAIGSDGPFADKGTRERFVLWR